MAGDGRQAVPGHLRLLWFADAEGKFCQGEFALPQETSYQLLKQGSWGLAKQKHVTYDEFTVCVLPRGVVGWLTAGNQVLVGRYQAHEITPSAADYARCYGDASRAKFVKTRRQQMSAHVQAEIKVGTLSTKK